MSNKLLSLLTILCIIILGMLNSLYVIDEKSYAIEFKFGKIHQIHQQPGLYFKIPFIQNVTKVDKRLLNINIYDSQITCTKDERIIISAFTKIKITDIQKFYITLNNNISTMQHRCKSIIESSIRNTMGQHTLNDLLSQKRLFITQKILTSIKIELHELGLNVVDFRIMRSDLPEKNHNAVIKQMISERKKEAEKIRSTGHELARKIRANGDKESKFLEAKAFEKSQKIRAEGDKIAAEIYSKTYKENEELYILLRNLESYKKSLSNNTLFILNPNSLYTKELKLTTK